MTVKELIKRLEKFVPESGKSPEVVVNWKSFEHSDWSHQSVSSIDTAVINWSINDDSAILADGSERQRLVVELCGGS